MSWAEFILRSIGFREERDFQMILARSQAYQTYCSSFVFGKKKPVTIEKFWPIGKKKKNKLSAAHEAAFRQAEQRYLQEVKKKENG